MMELRGMTSEEFAEFSINEIEEHARDVSIRDSIPLNRARDVIEEKFAGLLPQGVETAGHDFFTVLKDGNVVGRLWLRDQVQPDEDRRVVIMKIEIDEPYRGRGLGRELMKEVEALTVERDGWAVDLYVFGPNEVARSLYDSMGYQILGTQMRKALGPAPRRNF
jgi:ribosomal protein S18 acetylase RimI-like enzyme